MASFWKTRWPAAVGGIEADLPSDVLGNREAQQVIMQLMPDMPKDALLLVRTHLITAHLGLLPAHDLERAC